MKSIDETIRSVLEKRELAEAEQKRKKEKIERGMIVLCVAVAFVFAGLYFGDVIFPDKAPNDTSAVAVPVQVASDDTESGSVTESASAYIIPSTDALTAAPTAAPEGEATRGTITEAGISGAENSTETATVPVPESADNSDISELFVDCAYFMVSRKQTIDKDDFVKNAEFTKVDFVAGDFRYYKIVFDGKTLGYISNIKNDSHFYFSYSDDAGNMLNSPFLCTVLSDSKVNPREDVTIG